MAIAGKKRTVTREFILSKITDYDIFKLYYPGEFKLNKPCKSPFTDDRHPSMIIGNKFGDVTFKCFNSENRGDCFSFVMQLHKPPLSYNEALDKICKDFNLLNDGAKEVIAWEQPKAIVQPTLLQAESKPFTAADKAYLAQYHLTPKDLNFCPDTKAYSTLKWAINRQIQPMARDEICFHYHLKNERGEWLKIYRPNAPKKLKWKTNIPFIEMMGVGNISPGCKVGIVSKSLKDGAFIFKYILPCVELVQAEDYTAISPANKRRLKESCDVLYISFDNEPSAVKASIELVKEMDCKYINPPKDLYERRITDWTDWAKATDPQTVIDFFKNKKVI